MTCINSHFTIVLFRNLFPSLHSQLDNNNNHLTKLTMIKKFITIKSALLLISIVLLTGGSLFAQQRLVSGVVISEEDNLTLPGVTIIVKGTSFGSTTDLDGNYTLDFTDIANNNPILVFSFIGFSTKEIVIGNQTTINVSMATDETQLDEVVVLGYSTTKKTLLTAAVSSITAEDIQTMAVANASNALVGRVPGLITRQSSGAVGEDQAAITIRGVATTGNSAPLIIVDGIIRNSLDEIDPSVVETYSVLKDAAAVAPYGMSGANGVILITTKSGQKGAPKFQFNNSTGFQNPTLVQDYANSYEFASAFNQAEINAGRPETNRRYSAQDLESFRRSVNGDPSIDQNLYPNQDVWDVVINNNAPIIRNNITASGGGEYMNFFTGINQLHQRGNWSKSQLDRLGFIANLDILPTDKTKISVSLNGYNEQQKGPTSQGAEPYIAATGLLPTEPITWADGRLARSTRDVIMSDVLNLGDRLRDETQILSKISIEQELLKGLKIKGAFAYDWTTQFSKHWAETRSTYYNINRSTDPYTFNEIVSAVKPSLSQTQQIWKNYTYQAILSYDTSFGDHNLSLLGVAEARRTDYNIFSAGRSGFELPIPELSLGSADKDLQSNSGGSLETAQVGYVYKAGYDYKSKYLLELAGRYDGHFFFAPGQKYGFFPSASLGWRLTEESFMENIVFIDNLKLRTSWGQSGNLAGGPNQYSTSLALYENSFPFGNAPTQGVFATREGNPNITWEKAEKFNVGLEFSIFNGLISGEIDYFAEKRDNMLVNPSASVPTEYGIGLSQVNRGKMENQGIDLLLNVKKQFDKGIRAGVTLTYTFARNTLIETFENPITAADPVRSRTGKPLGSLFGLVADGLFQESDDINGDGIITPEDGFPEQKLGGVIRPGSIKYIDTNNDGIINLLDEQRIGFSPTPEIIYGLAPSFSWKGIDINLMFQGAANVSTYLEGTYVSAFAEDRNYPNFLLNDSWTPETPDARFPALSPNGLTANNSLEFSTFYLINASYLRLRNIDIGWTLPSKFTEKLNLSSLRVHVSGVNLFTWSDTMAFGIDAESSTDARRGWYHPQQRTISFGLNLGF